MSPTQIAALILGGILLLAVTAYLVQSIEAQRRQRQMRLLQLRDQIRRADHLFGSLPAFFVTPEIRALLLRYMEVRWKQVMELDRSDEPHKQLARLEEMAHQPFDPGQYPNGQLTQSPDRESARRSRALLRELAQFLVDLQKVGMFGNDTLAQLIQRVKQSYTRLTIELELLDAQETEQIAGPQVALHQYRSCLMKLQGFNNANQIDAQIFALQNRIDACQAVADQIKQETEEELRAKVEREREEQRRNGLH